jgi:hypothetical protein
MGFFGWGYPFGFYGYSGPWWDYNAPWRDDNARAHRAQGGEAAGYGLIAGDADVAPE